MNSGIVSFLFSLTESILLFWLINSILVSRYHGAKKTAVIWAAIFANAIAVYFLPNYPLLIKFLLYFAISFILIQIIYKGKIYIKAFFILVSNYIFLICDILAGNIASFIIDIDIQNIMQISDIDLSFSILAKLLNIFLIALLICYFKNRKFETHSKYWVMIDIIVVLFAAILQFIMTASSDLQKASNDYSLYICGVSIGILIISGLIIAFFGQICFDYEQEKKIYILNMQNHSLEQQLAYHESATANLKKIRHDINKDLVNISYLLRQNNIADSVSYIDSITMALNDTKPIVNCGNDIIDAILNYKIAICRRRNIDFHLEIDRIPSLSVSAIDLTAILANMLDNAIEALDQIKSGRRYLSGKIFCYKNYLSIVIKNPCAQQPVIENNKITTHKADKPHHGYGLSSIRSSSEKYGGFFNIRMKNNTFTAIVMLPIELES